MHIDISQVLQRILHNRSPELLIVCIDLSGQLCAAFSGAGRLASIRTYSDTFSIYVDPTGQQVRIITAD